VFAGGYTNRDYDLYVSAAELLPRIPFVLACATANRLRVALPPNLRIISDSSSTDFHRILGAARLVVLPLKKDLGSSGQMVAVAAMQLAKCVIYTDIPVVGQYFSDGQTGIACPIGDLDRLVALIARWYPDEAGAERVGRAARVVANQTFSADTYESAVARHASEFMAASRDRGATHPDPRGRR
jgi:glycosyltransferase involved in cell wall biosynthesis